ncbi:unnamed protein product [Acanthoscelides obtectus]|uniref:Uncharacterized protein n=1 Tax=Acanthoscelides obtectus TaxID=200917 RepID=A0A9P0MDZ8_ACAOB|nr:unnamed protein product [Acanthoscelides obtectus]CAK1635684.1 hypothetical protein AOBTE_LOCUS9439 [Acanthoscelides obtectus]
MDNPSNKDIMKTIQQKFSEIEKALNFNGEVMEGLQRTIKDISDENRELRKTQEHLKNRVAELEKEVVTLKKNVSKDEDEARKKRVIIKGIKGNQNIDENVKKVFLKLGMGEPSYKVFVLSKAEVDPTVVAVQFDSVEQRNTVIEKRKSLSLSN